MHPFDKEVLRKLQIDTETEQKLKQDPSAAVEFAENIRKSSGNVGVYFQLKDTVTVSRIMRYVEWPAHRSGLVQMMYVASGTADITIGGNQIHLQTGDFLMPNQYSDVSIKPLKDRDVLLNFILKPQFIEDTCLKLETSTALSQFMLDTLQQDASWNRYLHFSGLEDLAALNMVETIAYAAYQDEITDETITCGRDADPEITKTLCGVLFMSLAKNLEALSEQSAVSYEEIVRKTVCDYIATDYRTASLQDLAEKMNQTEATLSRQIKTLLGMNFKELLLRKRFERAMVLLQQTNLSIGAVAIAVGYENTSFFYRRFREIYGISPKDCRGS